MSRRSLLPPPSLLDRLIGWADPVRGARRLQARAAIAVYGAYAGGYTGARRDRRATSRWNAGEMSADGALLGDLALLRNRSNDLVRNEPLARGAINTNVTSAIGPGLALQARPDRVALRLADSVADEWERTAEELFAWWAHSKACDVTGAQRLDDMAKTVLRSVLIDGDHFVLRRFVERSGQPLGLALQLIDAARVDTPFGNSAIAGGVERDGDGRPLAYHVLRRHPGDFAGREFVRLPAFDESGQRLTWHLFERLRADQSRGEPYLAPVIEPLKQLGRYTEAEIMAAVISGMFTVFVKSMGGAGLAPASPTGETGGASADDDYKLAPGAMIDLAPGEDVSFANPGRPNTAYDPFVMSILRQIGVALELPFEVLIKHFTASYSAARAAILEAWRFFLMRRSWMAAEFYQPAYEAMLTEAVARGLLNAPGFFADPLIRAAWCAADWIGRPPGQLNPVDETNALKTQVEMGWTTNDRATAEINGGDWARNHAQLVKERRRRQADGLDASAAASAQPRPPADRPQQPDRPDQGDQEDQA